MRHTLKKRDAPRAYVRACSVIQSYPKNVRVAVLVREPVPQRQSAVKSKARLLLILLNVSSAALVWILAVSARLRRNKRGDGMIWKT